MSIRIAVASADGKYVDQHFGSAKIFRIYLFDGFSFKEEDPRITDAYCKGNCEGGFDHLLRALHDCDAVFVIKIGLAAAEFMIGSGKRVFEATGKVENLLKQLITDKTFETSETHE
mgnify:CR=1 FL=1